MQSRLAQRVVRDAAATVVAATHAAQTADRPRGLGARHTRLPPVDPVTLKPIPASRAVRVGPHVFDATMLRRLLATRPGATNPLTREPLPAWVHDKYGGAAARAPEPAIWFGHGLMPLPFRSMTRSTMTRSLRPPSRSAATLREDRMSREPPRRARDER